MYVIFFTNDETFFDSPISSFCPCLFLDAYVGQGESN